jgi:hypothetical protein
MWFAICIILVILVIASIGACMVAFRAVTRGVIDDTCGFWRSVDGRGFLYINSKGEYWREKSGYIVTADDAEINTPFAIRFARTAGDSDNIDAKLTVGEMIDDLHITHDHIGSRMAWVVRNEVAFVWQKDCAMTRQLLAESHDDSSPVRAANQAPSE